MLNFLMLRVGKVKFSHVKILRFKKARKVFIGGHQKVLIYTPEHARSKV